MPAFSEDQVIALAPDDSSVKSGKELAAPRKWVSFGASEKAVWGECQGSGARPYQTAIDISEPAFKCSCPSRKFPCKHGLGLLLLYCRAESTFENKALPDWVGEWLQSRSQRAEQKTKKKEEAATAVVDLASKAKRQAERQAKVEAGLADFHLWIQDRVRQGLAGLESQSYHFWDGAAARLTDAQAPGLARALRQCAGIPASGEGWQARLLERLSLMHLAAEGYTRIAGLPDDLQQDLRSIIGFTQSQEELLRESGIKDRWQVLGQRIDVEDRLKMQRTWLRGETCRQWALVFSFAYGTQPLDISLPPGIVLEAELVFFPAALKLRALVKTRAEKPACLSSFAAYSSAAEFLEDYSSALGLNPWLESFPVALENVVAGCDGGGKFLIVDSEKSIVPASISESARWQILALSGGHPFSLFGEWNGDSLLPLSLFCAGNFARLNERLVANVV